MLASNGMRLARELRSPLFPALVLAAAAIFFARDPGSASLPWLGVAAFAFVGVLFATQSPPNGAVVFAPLAALAVWCALSVAWSVEPDRSWGYTNRAFVYLAFALVGAYLGRDLRRLLLGFSGLLGAVCIWALAGKVFPWLHEGYGRIARLSAPIGYWNALALLGDIALPLGLCLATRRRVAGTLLVYGWLVVIGLTFSRGGVLVAVVVVALWMILSKAWLETVSTLLAAGLPALATLAVGFALSGVTSDGQPHTTRVRDGLVFGVVLLVNAAIAAALSRFELPATTLVRRVALAVLAVTVAVSVAAGAAHAHSWWNSFTKPSATELTNSQSRLVELGSNFRWGWWTQAWDGWKANPIVGTGAGSFDVTNKRYRQTSLDETIEPHSLPVQFLSETGLIGVALFVASVGWLIVRSRRRPGPQLALALALPAYFLHGLLDIDWDFISVSAPVFMIAGALAVRPSERPRPQPFAVLTACGVLAVASLSLIAVWLGGHWESQAEAALQENNAKALTLAKRAHSVNPLSVAPLLTAAAAQSGIAGENAQNRTSGWAKRYTAATGAAISDLTQATQLQPDNALAWYLLGSFRLAEGCPYAALPAFNRATVYDGKKPAYAEAYRTTLIRVNSGTEKCWSDARGTLGVSAQAPTITMSWPPCSALRPTPSTGATTFTPRSLPSRMPSAR